MKKASVLLLILAAATPIAWNSIQADGVEIGYFGAAVGKLSRVNNLSASFVGLRGGVILEHRIVVGLVASDLVGSVRDTSVENSHDLGMWYGGLDLEYVVPPRQKLSLTVGSTFGIGQFRVLGSSSASDNIGVIEPEVGLTYPVSSAVQVGATGGYRLALLTNLMSNLQAGGPVGSVIVRVGKF